MTLRQFAAIVGVAAAIAGLIALSIPITAEYTSSLSGIFTSQYSSSCGSAFAPDIGGMSGAPFAACRDAIGDRRMWGAPLLIAGAVIAAGAVLVEANTHRPASEPADSSD